MARVKKEVAKVTGTVEQVVDPMLDVAGGAFIAENVNAIKDAKMRKAVERYAKGVNDGQKAAWDVAKACASMKIEMRKEFGSDERLADFLGFANKGQFSRVQRTGLLAGVLQPTGITASNAHELLPMAKTDKDGKPKNYIITLEEFIEQNGRDLSIYTQKELREMVAKYKKPSEDAEESADAEESSGSVESEVTETEQGEQEEVHWNDILRITDKALNSLSDEQKSLFEDKLSDLIDEIGLDSFGTDIWICSL